MFDGFGLLHDHFGFGFFFESEPRGSEKLPGPEMFRSFPDQDSASHDRSLVMLGLKRLLGVSEYLMFDAGPYPDFFTQGREPGIKQQRGNDNTDQANFPSRQQHGGIVEKDIAAPGVQLDGPGGLV